MFVTIGTKKLLKVLEHVTYKKLKTLSRNLKQILFKFFNGGDCLKKQSLLIADLNLKEFRYVLNLN